MPRPLRPPDGESKSRGAESIGHGGGAALAIVNAGMAASLRHYQPKDRWLMQGTGGHIHERSASARRRKPSPRKRKESPITAEDALQILQSALHYCQQAKMSLTLNDSTAGATVIIGGCRVVVGNDGMARLVMNEANDSITLSKQPHTL